MAETPAHGISDQATYLLLLYLLRRQEMQDLAARKYPTACDELLGSLAATGPKSPTEIPTGDNVVALFASVSRASDAFDELRTLVLRVRRLWRTDEQIHHLPKPAET